MTDAAVIAGSLVDVRNVEEWRPVVGFEKEFAVSRRGAVKSLARQYPVLRNGKTYINRVSEKILKGGINTSGYRHVSLKGRFFQVSWLVATAFIGPRPPGCQVCHRDGVRLNDAVSNLRYDTRCGNIADRRLHGTEPLGEAKALAKLVPAQVKEIRELRGKLTQRALAQRYGVSGQTIKEIQLGRAWLHVK